MPLHRGDLRRLMLQRIEPVEVTHQGLDRRHDQRHPHGHREHLADRRIVPAAQQVPGRRRPHHESRGEKRRDRHVGEAIREGRVEDHRQPVHRHHDTVDDLVPLRRMHPAVGRQNPEGRDQRAERHHHRGEEMQARADAIPAEQHDTEKTRFEEECRQHLVSQQGAGNATGELRKGAPVGAELVGHDDARDHPHAEVDREYLHPEMVEIAIERALGFQPQAFQHRQVTGQADGDGREDDVKRNGEGELDSRKLESLQSEHEHLLVVWPRAGCCFRCLCCR